MRIANVNKDSLAMPYVILKSAMSVDGYIDDCQPERLLLSNKADFDRVDQIRAECDAILVGAGTIRADNPTLLVKSSDRQKNRTLSGLLAQPLKVTLTKTGLLPAQSKFFTKGDGKKIVYCPREISGKLFLQHKSNPSVDIQALDDLTIKAVLADLQKREVKKVLIEGGTNLATSCLAENVVDELQISLAPFFLGEDKAPRLTHRHAPYHNSTNPMHLSSIEQLGDVVLITYLLNKQP